MLQNESGLPDPLATSLKNTTLYDSVINTVADIHLRVSLQTPGDG